LWEVDVASDEENAEFRGELRTHMRNTSAGIKEIKEDARRQTTATDSLRIEVIQGLGKLNTRVALVERAQSDHEAHALTQTAECETRLGKIESNGSGGVNKKHTAAGAGAGATVALLLRELIVILKGAFP
jgi:hypothetical protein